MTELIAETKMNFAAVNMVDPYAKSLLETAAHVALYIFQDSEWEKTDIEGALFVYSRTGEPFHNILIMNRLNMRNLVEPVTQGLDLQLQDPFLLYRNSHNKIYGIWFYDKKECVKIASTLTKIVRESGFVQTEKRDKILVETGGANIDICSMLTKAQEEYNMKSPRKTLGKGGLAPHDLNFNGKDTEQTPQSVMDFFAKASNGTKFISDPAATKQPSGLLNSSRPGPPGLTRMQSVPIAIPLPQSDVKPLLERLMSNPAHSVEHIEKQQQAITPQSERISKMQNGSVLSKSNGSESKTVLDFNIKQSPNASILNDNVNKGVGLLPQVNYENNLGFLRISDSPTPNKVQTQQYFNSKLLQKHSPLIGDVPLEPNMNSIENPRPLTSPLETQTKPALMPPVMFTSSAKKETLPEPYSNSTLVTLSSTSGSMAFTVRPEPLTKNQLLQAVNYLLKNDPDFINKLHEAYVKSFADLVL